MTLQTRGKRKVDAQTEVENLAAAIADAGGGGASLSAMVPTAIAQSSTITANGAYICQNTSSSHSYVYVPVDGSVTEIIFHAKMGVGSIGVRPSGTLQGHAKSSYYGQPEGEDIKVYYLKFNPTDSSWSAVKIGGYSFDDASSRSGPIVYEQSTSLRYVTKVDASSVFIPKARSTPNTTSVTLAFFDTNPYRWCGFAVYDIYGVLGGSVPSVIISRLLHNSKKITITKKNCRIHISSPYNTHIIIQDLLTGHAEIADGSSDVTIDDSWGVPAISYKNPKREYKEASTTSFGTTTSSTTIFGGIFKIESKGAGTGAADNVATKMYHGSLFDGYYITQLNNNIQPHPISTDGTFLDLGNVSVLGGTSLRAGVISAGADGKPICDYHIYMYREADTRTMHWRLKIDWYVEPLVLT